MKETQGVETMVGISSLLLGKRKMGWLRLWMQVFFGGGGIMGILDESEDHRKTVHWKRNSPSGNNPAHIYTSAIPPAAITYPQGAFSHAVILSILLSQSRDPVW